ncbi:MAG: TIGR03905 family TSCPD domain-containing protein [Erysipelotrichaceae bacterium]|nr:TIGR03905 family TSCPD domain-containing protein [Erysipelotrichaceae bacterium]
MSQETFVYMPKGVCSKKMEFVVEGDQIVSLQVTGGCNGNLNGISSILKGMSVDRVIEAFDGTRCGFKDTSCPDQIAQALKEHYHK